MSTPTNVATDPALDRPAQAPAPLARTRPFYWSVRREIWEYRALYIAPLIAAGVVLLGFTLGIVRPHGVHVDLAGMDAAKKSHIAVLPYYIAASSIIFTAFVVSVFYCLGALQNERRDRSILFWKSLPVSDLTTVLSKVTIPLLILPPIVFVVALATQLVMLLLSEMVLLAGGPAAMAQVPILQMTVGLAYTLVAIALWYAPIYGWLLLVSGWARARAFLWAVLPPLALMIAEEFAFGTAYVWDLLKYRLLGVFEEGFLVVKTAHGKDVIPVPQIDAVRFLSTPGLWLGLAFAAAFVAAAIWLRRYREPV